MKKITQKELANDFRSVLASLLYKMHMLSQQLLLICCILLTVQAKAAIIETHKIQGHYLLSKDILYLEDSSGKLSLEKLLSAKNNRPWQHSEAEVPSFGFSNSAYWLKFSLKNTTANHQDWLLELDYPHHDFLDLYVVSEDGKVISKFETGARRAFHHRTVNYRNFVYKLELEPFAVKHYFLHSRSASSMQFPLHLWSPVKFTEKAAKEKFELGIYYGIMLVVVFYNAFIFLSLKKIIYLYYILYIGFFALYQFSFNGLLLQYVLPEHPNLAKVVLPFAGIFCGFWLLVFIRSFLQTPQNCPRIDKLIKYYLFASLSIAAMTIYIPYNISIVLGALFAIATPPIIFILASICLKNGYRPARYIVAAFLFFILGVVSFHISLFGLYRSDFIAKYAVQIGSALEVILLSLALADKIKIEQAQAKRKIDKLNSDLERHLKNVEHLVAEKTRDIKSILANIQQGIFMITPDNLTVHKDHSSYLCEILGSDSFEGKNVLDVFLNKTNLTKDQISQIKFALEVSLESDEMNFASNSHCLPQSVIYKANPQALAKTLNIDWIPVVDCNQNVDKILITLRDETKWRELCEQNKLQQLELEHISQVLKVAKDDFECFLKTCDDFARKNQQLIDNEDPVNSEALKAIFVNIHTMKGLSRNYKLKYLTEAIHQAETNIQLMLDGQLQGSREELAKNLKLISLSLSRYRYIHEEKLERKSSYEAIELTQNDVEGVLARLQYAENKTHHPNAKGCLNEIQKLLLRKFYIEAEKTFEKICSGLSSIAKELHKEAPEVAIKAAGYAFTKQGEALISQVFVHLLRNSIDHGIECQELRLQKGKPIRGKIAIDVLESGTGMVIKYRDDGAGLNVDKIRKVAIAKAYLAPDEQLSLEMLAEMIFQSGLSTAEELTDISGRGVGMDAIRRYLEKEGGSVDIRLMADRPIDGKVPFEFILTVPRQFYIKLKEGSNMTPVHHIYFMDNLFLASN